MELLIVPGILVLGAVLAALAVGGSILLFKVFGKASRLDALEERYLATAAPPGEMLTRQWLAVGQVYYKNTTDICISPEGFYFWVHSSLSRSQPVLIPWHEFTGQRSAILAGQRAVRLIVGEPEVATIVIRQRLYERIQPHLGPAFR